MYEVSYKRIREITGMSKSVIHGRLEFLKENGFLKTPIPKINAINCGFNCKVYNFIRFEKNRKELYEKFVERIMRDSHTFRFGDARGYNFNVCLLGVYRNDIEWQVSFRNYFKALPELHDAIRERITMVIPLKYVQKEISPSLSVINTLEAEKNADK